MRLFRLRIVDIGLRIVGESPQSASLRPQWARLLVWFLAGSVSAVVIGWLAAKIHASGHAPLGLTSLGVGAVLGATLSFLAAQQLRAHTRLLVLSAVFFAILTIVAEHAWLYIDFRRQWNESRANSPAVAMFRPEEPLSPRAYFDHDWNPKLWLADAALVIAATVAVFVVARRYDTHSDTRHPTPDT